MCRGNRREAIFLDDKDRRLFVDTLAEGCERSGFQVHGYVMMSNHYHLLLETPEGNLVAGMRWIQTVYTLRFNARHHLSGHLFQGRYKAIPIETKEATYLRIASDYIHLNPARAGLLDPDHPQLGSYPWSSYGFFVGGKTLPPWLVRKRVFKAHGLGDEGAANRRRFREVLARRVDEVLGKTESEEQLHAWASVRQGWALGGEGFIDWLQARVSGAMKGRRRASFVGERPVRRHDEEEAERLAKEVEEKWSVERWAGRPANDPEKQTLAWLLRSRTTAGGAWIAARLAMGHVSNVSRAYRALQNPRANSSLGKLKKSVMRICK